MCGERTKRMDHTVLVAMAASLCLLTSGAADAAVGYASFTNSYSQNFSTLPYQSNLPAINAAATVTFSPNSTINSSTNVRYALPTVAGTSFSLSDTTLGTITSTGGGNAAIASGMDGWWGSLATADRLGQNDGSFNSGSGGINFSGGLISLGAQGSGNRALGLVSSSTSGAATAALALLNDSGSAIDRVSISLTAQLWTQQTNRKYLSFSYAVAPASSITSNTSGGAVIPTTTITDANLSPAFATAAYSARDFSTPVSSGTLSDTLDLGTPWGAGEILWLKWTTFNGGTFTAASGGDGIFGTASGGAASSTSNAQQIGLSSLTISVPEPASVTLIAMGPLLVLRRRRHQA